MASQAQDPEIPAREGAVSRVIGALANPRPTFESIARKPSWLMPLLLLIVLDVALTFSFGYRVGWRGFMEKQFANSSRTAQLSAAQQQQALDRAVRLAPMFGYLGGTVGTGLILLAIAAIFLAAFNVVFGTGIRFGQAFGITVHGFLPAVVRGALGLLVVWLRPPEGIDLRNLVMSNLGAFLPAGASTWVRTLATSIDVFAFWTLGLLAIGFAAAGSSKKVSLGGALTVVIVVWLVYLLGVVGFTALFT